jgi:hypothetical protein
MTLNHFQPSDDETIVFKFMKQPFAIDGFVPTCKRVPRMPVLARHPIQSADVPLASQELYPGFPICINMLCSII